VIIHIKYTKRRLNFNVFYFYFYYRAGWQFAAAPYAYLSAAYCVIQLIAPSGAPSPFVYQYTYLSSWWTLGDHHPITSGY
jgi:hypothetical protein